MNHLPINEALLQRLNARASDLNMSLEDWLNVVLDAPPFAPSADNILHNIADGVLTVDDDQRIIWLNPAAASMFGYQADELRNRPLSDLILPEDCVRHHQHMQHFLKEGEVSRYMEDREAIRALHRDGSIVYVEISLLRHNHLCTAIIRDATDKVARFQNLSEQEARLRMLTEHASDIIGLHEPDGTLVYISESSRRLLGYAPDLLIGSQFLPYLHPDDSSKLQDIYATIAEQDEITSVIYRFRHQDGHYLWLETKLHVVLSEADQPIHIVSYSRDITERKDAQDALRAERDLLKTIMDANPTGITVVDPTGNIIFANRRAEEIHGAPTEDIEERTYDDSAWVHTDYDGNPWPDEKQPFVRVMQTRQAVWDVRHAIEWPNGERVYLAINGVPVFDHNGEISKVVFSVEDYTSRKLQEDALAAALAREKHLNEMKSAFISLVAHEFRTPMAVIMSSTGILRHKLAELNDVLITRRIARIDAQIARLDQMLDDVTFINRSEIAGLTIHPIPIDLDNFFQTVLEEVKMAVSSGARVVVSGTSNDHIVWLDMALLQQIFINLISNALKYTPDNGSINVRYGISEDTVTVDIIDTGIGIPDDEQQRLFSTFFRASNVGSIAGTGLGLSIVKRAIDVLGGEIVFTSRSGEGTHFTVKLPRRIDSGQSRPTNT